MDTFLPVPIAIVLSDSFEILTDEILEDWKSVGRESIADMNFPEYGEISTMTRIYIVPSLFNEYDGHLRSLYYTGDSSSFKVKTAYSYFSALHHAA